MLRWLVLVTVAAGCLLPAVEYEPAAEASGAPLAPSAASECAEPGACCPGPSCAQGAPTDVVCSGADGTCPSTEAPRSGLPLAPAAPSASLPPAPAASCSDRLHNQDETDEDCGGLCGSTCPLDRRCQRDQDCAADLFCSAFTRRCALISCSDGEQNGKELQTDCGGGECPGCSVGAECTNPSDCASNICELGACRALPLCVDEELNGDETDVDCGGPVPGCDRCADGASCVTDTDCAFGDCAQGVCISCQDEARNGSETGVDCGGAALTCPRCGPDQPCALDRDCQSGSCSAGVCVSASCDDAEQNGNESAVDCGGSCPRCADRLTCNVASDCINNACFNGVCISCGSGVIDGTETDIDCGGSDPACRRCDPGDRCLVNSDCTSGFCIGGVC